VFQKPPVMNITFSASDGVSFSGLKSTNCSRVGMVMRAVEETDNVSDASCIVQPL
jgi:hypothetical protein